MAGKNRIENIEEGESRLSVQDPNKEIEFFDAMTDGKEYDVFTEYGYQSIINEFSKLTFRKLKAQSKVIDLGCGSGAFISRLVHKVDGMLYGVDISSNAIRVASQKNDGVCYHVGDILNLSIPDNTFDVVIFSAVLHHFQNFSGCLNESLRILKPGGMLFSFDPNIHNPMMWLYRHPSSPFFSQLGKTENEILLSEKMLNSELTNAGFDNIDSYAIGGVTFKFVESRKGKRRWLLPLYNTFETVLGKTPLAKKYGSFLLGYAQKPE